MADRKRKQIFLLAILGFIQITGLLCQLDYRYRNCTEPRRCGRFEIGFPFWGGDRPKYCGHPDFELIECDEPEYPRLKIGSIFYKVLDIQNTTHTMEVALEDLWDGPCPTDKLQSPTLNSDLFHLSDYQNITLHFGCGFLGNPESFDHTINSSRFNCRGNENNFYQTRELDSLRSFKQCDETLHVPVKRIIFERLSAGTMTLQDALKSGSSITWSANNRECERCMKSGGTCGYEDESSTFTCYCRDKPYPVRCNADAENKSSDKKGLIIGLCLGGAVLASVALGCLVFLFRQRSKKRIAINSVHDLSKEITTSSSNYTSTSSNFTKSIPSYPSSRLDLCRSRSSYGVHVFSFAELEQATNNFDPSRELGDGGFGTVYYGMLEDGRAVAVKRLYENNVKRVEQFMNEVRILTQLTHKNLVLLYGCTSKSSRDLLLVYEYISNGTVADHLHGKRAKSGLLSWSVRLNIAIETAEALAYLHKNVIIHRDVKTNNVLLDNDFHVKVADFGLSRLFPIDVTHVSTAPQGTPGYVDPEYYQCYQLTERSDVFSFGVMLIELISSLPAVDITRHRHDINLSNMAINKIHSGTLHEMVDKNLGFERDNTVKRMITSVAELAFQCLQQERDMRPSMEDVLETLKGIQNENLKAHKVDIVDILADEDQRED